MRGWSSWRRGRRGRARLASLLDTRELLLHPSSSYHQRCLRCERCLRARILASFTCAESNAVRCAPATMADPSLLAALTDMGFPAESARAALVATGNANLETALTLLCGEAAEVPVPALLEEEECKAVLVVDASLNMSVGKTAAQAAHAAVGLFRLCAGAPWLHAWEAGGEKTVCLRGEGREELARLAAHSRSLGLPTCEIEDAGRTEVTSGSLTVVGIAGRASQVDLVTGSLRTLR